MRRMIIAASFAVIQFSAFSATISYGPAKAVVGGDGGTFEWNGSRIIEKIEIYLAGKTWVKLFPTGREEWETSTNNGVLRFSVRSPYTVAVSFTPLSNGIRGDIAIDIPAGSEAYNAVIDIFLAKNIFLNCTMYADGTAMDLDPAKSFPALKASTYRFAVPEGWRCSLASKRPGAWSLRSSVGSKWRPEELRTFDIIYSVDGITSAGLSDACSFELTAETPSISIHHAPVSITGLPPDLSVLAMANVDRFFPSGSTVPAFTNGDVVCFIGDSITHRGNYIRYISDFYAKG